MPGGPKTEYASSQRCIAIGRQETDKHRKFQIDIGKKKLPQGWSNTATGHAERL